MLIESNLTHHPITENIHHERGCLTSLGILCNACCVFFEVKPLEKKAGIPCRHLQCGKGCKIHNHQTQPSICRDYHCSRELVILNNPLIGDRRVRLAAFSRVEGLLSVSLEQGTISEQQFQESREHWIKKRDLVYGIDVDEE